MTVIPETVGVFQQPNDLAVMADGSVIVTDPPDTLSPDPWDLAGKKARVYRYRQSPAAGEAPLTLLAEVDHYMNGVAVSPEGRVLVVEARGLRWLDDDGRRSWLIEDLGAVADGMKFDANGNVYACLIRDGIAVVSGDGKVVDRLDPPPGSLCLNCCFGGPDLHTLFVTDAATSRLLVWDRLPVPGMRLAPFPAPALDRSATC